MADKRTPHQYAQFTGVPWEIRIVSNRTGLESVPQPGDEVEQCLSINGGGCVQFSAYKFGNAGEEYQNGRTTSLQLEKDFAKRILNRIAGRFRAKYDEIPFHDIENWVMEIANTDGEIYQFQASLCAEAFPEAEELSDFIRSALKMGSLYVFDGGSTPDIIERITIDYHKITKYASDESTQETEEREYSETLCIDRKTGILELVQSADAARQISHRYECQSGVEYLLDFLGETKLFFSKVESSGEMTENLYPLRKYTVMIEYQKDPPRILTGCFDQDDLPDDYGWFAEIVLDFMNHYGQGDIFNSFIYQTTNRPKQVVSDDLESNSRKIPDFIYCSVEFEENGKSYYYITDDDTFQIGDYAEVPAGKDNHLAIVKIVKKEYFSEEDAPSPPEKTKRIIRKYADTDEKLSINGGVEMLSPSSKKSDLLAFLEPFGYPIAVHTDQEPEHDYLSPGGLEIEVVNPGGDENLYFMLEDEFTLCFAGWHAHYFAYESEYSALKEDAKAILENKKAALSVFSAIRWLGSTLTDTEFSYRLDESELMKQAVSHQEFLDEISLKGGRLQAIYWNSDNSYFLDLWRADEKPIYKFPRRGGMRYIVEDGKVLVSGEIREYEPGLACLQYLYTDQSIKAEKREFLYQILLEKLEADAAAAGFPSIFALCLREDADFYLML